MSSTTVKKSNVNPPPSTFTKTVDVEKDDDESLSGDILSAEAEAKVNTGCFLGLGGLMAIIVVVASITRDGNKPEPVRKPTISKFSNGTELIAAVDKFANNSISETSKYGATMSVWDVSSVTNFDSVCSGERNTLLATYPCNVSAWNVSQATSMVGMFEGNTAFDADVSKWDVRKVVNMTSMFASTGKFNGNLTTWVSTCTAFIRNCAQITILTTLFCCFFTCTESFEC